MAGAGTLVALIDAYRRQKIAQAVSLDSAVVASVIVAVGFNPARVRLQRLIDRGLYGDRRDPVRAVSLVGERLAGTGAAGLPGVLAALCDSLRLPFAAVRFGTAEAAAHGTAPELLHSIRLSYDGARIGELIVGLRSGQRRLSPPDIAVLELLACPPAVALHATALSAALQESRVSIVAAREEERRRLRRDLHDGLGPALTGIAFKADAARNALPAAPAQASELLGELRADTTAAIADIRRLVYGLRPPALDDLGLICASRRPADRAVLGIPNGGSRAAFPQADRPPHAAGGLTARIGVRACVSRFIVARGACAMPARPLPPARPPERPTARLSPAGASAAACPAPPSPRQGGGPGSGPPHSSARRGSS